MGIKFIRVLFYKTLGSYNIDIVLVERTSKNRKLEQCAGLHVGSRKPTRFLVGSSTFCVRVTNLFGHTCPHRQHDSYLVLYSLFAITM